MTDKIAVLTTCATWMDAEKIANAVLEPGLAACVNILGGVGSRYRWKGEIEKSVEQMLVIKTRRELFDRVREAVEKVHPYELPEIVALPIAAGSPAYLNWIDEETTPR
jgi:periplasmic divalent cation tolerance protein